MGALPARVTLVPLRSFRERINHKNGHGVPDFEISARTKVKLPVTKNLKVLHNKVLVTGNLTLVRALISKSGTPWPFLWFIRSRNDLRGTKVTRAGRAPMRRDIFQIPICIF
jgi:hypothetical protein